MKDYFEVTDFSAYSIVNILKDELTIHNTSQFLHKLRTEVLDRSSRHIIMDLKNIRYADSSFLAKLIMIHKELRKTGKKLVLISVQEDFHDIMRLAQLDKLLVIKPDINSAVSYIG